MVTRCIALAAIVALGLPQMAHAACTQEQAMAKGQQFSQLMQQKMMQDPAKGQALMTQMQSTMMANQQTGTTMDWDKLCTQYDSLIQQAQQ